MISILLLVLVMAVVPYAVLGSRRSAYAVLDMVSYATAAAIGWLAPALNLRLDDSLALAILFAGKVGIFLAFLAAAREVPQWNENWAAVFAGAIYLSLVPHVLQWPIDGDEPFYLLVTESLVQDGDFDLRNQYAEIERSATRRPDLRPQLGDPVGASGEQYSRTEPFLSLLLVPGFVLFGLPGAVGTIALFGALLARSILLLLREEGVSDRAARICFGFLTFGPPILFYSIRIWPEVPAAYFFVEALRAIRGRRVVPFLLTIATLSLLKLRFVLVAAGLVVAFVLREPRRWRVMALAGVAVLTPLLIAFAVTGQWLNVHELWELRPQQGWAYIRGLFGLLLDARAGILFQAPFYLLAVVALFRWRDLPESARMALLCSIPYLVLLLPRSEWHGGWSPPLRYLAFLFPLLLLSGARLAERLPAPLLLLLGLITAALVIHGTAYPWRLFHIANGETALGEWFSIRYGADFSRVLPSFIRPNTATIVVSLLAVLAILGSLVFFRFRTLAPRTLALSISIAGLCLLVAGLHRAAITPGKLVHFEDSHVRHRGGELHPHVWTVARFLFTGGWTLRPGDEVEFRYRGGESRLFYRAAAPVRLIFDGKVTDLPGGGGQFASIDLTLSDAATHMIRCLTGEVTLDRIAQK